MLNGCELIKLGGERCSWEGLETPKGLAGRNRLVDCEGPMRRLRSNSLWSASNNCKRRLSSGSIFAESEFLPS